MKESETLQSFYRSNYLNRHAFKMIPSSLLSRSEVGTSLIPEVRFEDVDPNQTIRSSQPVAESESHFSSQSVGLRIQKKLASKMSTKGVAKQFVDGTTSDLLDHVYKLAKAESGGKKDAEKLLKNIIKIVVKIGLLYRNHQLDKREMGLADKFRQKFKFLAMTVVSFCEVDFTFDKDHLGSQIGECESILHELVQRHLTEKSHGRIKHVFNFFNRGDFLEQIFQKDGKYRDSLENIVVCLNKLMEQGEL